MTVHNGLPERSGGRRLLQSAAVPFVVLAFMIAFPLIGLAVFARYAIQTAYERRSAIAMWAKNAALFFAAPFFALFYIALLPMVLAGMLIAALRARLRLSDQASVGRSTEKP
jgi:hypothetical protein